MKKLFLFLLFVTLFITKQNAQDFEFKANQIDIKYERFVLPNGLTLLVHEDHKAPIAAVNVWYHVGSKNEKPGKSGFAHLFEHLMFNGSENFNDDYFQALERIGGTDLNGTTNSDRTNYFQNIPVSALDQVLFLESDRMGHLLGAIDQAKLDEQRGVVQNEKRQGDNQPYGKQWDFLTHAMYPKGHPYSWTVIGEMEDLNAASLEDVQEWFKSYYGAANAVVAVAGDINPQEVYKKVLAYFGDIPSGPTVARQEVNIPFRNGDTYQVYEDRVPESRILFAWNTPQFGAKEDIHFDLISSILTTGKNSRLYKRLVYDDQIASSVVSFQASSEISSNFVTWANVKPGEDVDRVQKIMEEELTKLMNEGPSEKELKSLKPGDDKELDLRNKLTADKENSKRITTIPYALQSENNVVTSFDDFKAREDEVTNLMQINNKGGSGKLWVGTTFDAVLSRDFSFNFPNLDKTSPVDIKIAAYAFVNQPLSSSFTISAGGASTGIFISGVGGGPHSNVANPGSNSFSYLSNTDNISVNVRYNKPSAVNAAGYLDLIEVQGRRKLIMEGNQMEFRDVNSVGSGNISKFELSTNTNVRDVWDVTNPVEIISIGSERTTGKITFYQKVINFLLEV